ncbi:hypothetical protein J1N35_011075, partial [Gossypium stocksii]
RPTVNRNDQYGPKKNFRVMGPYGRVGLHAQIVLSRMAHTAWPKIHMLNLA